MTQNRDTFVTSTQVIDHLQGLADETQARHLMRFFKTAPGEYGYGDQFLGIKVPVTRTVAKRATALSLNEVTQLLQSSWHEVRLCGLLVLVAQFEAQCARRLLDNPDATRRRDELVRFYLYHAESANNWDLVDLSVYKILGRWLMTPSAFTEEQKLQIVDKLADNDNLWRQRMSMVCTLEPLRQGEAFFTLRYAQWHLHHPHDLMQKAVGWMLREMGKRVSVNLLRDFLAQHAHTMPRTALRYAIEHLPDDERRHWLTL